VHPQRYREFGGLRRPPEERTVPREGVGCQEQHAAPNERNEVALAVLKNLGERAERRNKVLCLFVGKRMRAVLFFLGGACYKAEQSVVRSQRYAERVLWLY